MLDFDYVKSSCTADLVIKEKATTGYQVYPFQSSSNSITTETTNSPYHDIIISNGTVNFKSNFITLQPGFMVAKEACLNAEIKPCE